MKLRAMLVDDEELAIKRLSRLLDETGRVQVVATSQDPVEAVGVLQEAGAEVLFLDINMPGLTGFELLKQLAEPPMVVFTTAYGQYALRAFEASAIDYLVKPIEREALDRAITKLERMRGEASATADIAKLLEQVGARLRAAESYPKRLTSKLGEKVELVDLAQVTHIVARDKLTFAVTPQKEYVLDDTITTLEQRLDPDRFLRVHRSTMVNLDYVREVHTWFAGRLMLRLSDAAKTEVAVARERVKELREKLGY